MTRLKALHFAGSDYVVDPEDLNKHLLTDLQTCGAPGPADGAVEYVMATYMITGDESDCQNYLKGYGAWEEEELEDHTTNLMRLVWLTGCSLSDNESAYFSTY